jgi:hypothetical protein
MTVGKPFQKGQSGNPGGRPKVVAEVKELAREHTAEAIHTLVSIMSHPKAAPALRDGDTLLVTKLDRLARSTPDLYRIISELTERGVAFKVVDDPSIDTSSRTGKLIMGILALIAEFENDIRRERQQDGINKAKAEGVRFGPKPLLTSEMVRKIKELRAEGQPCRRSRAEPSSVRHQSIEHCQPNGSPLTPGGRQKLRVGLIVASRQK